jgi:1-acyl-sn-glycerol-3-phosphate acyltransferase
MLFWLGRGILAILLRIMSRTQVVGRAHVPRRGGVVLAANHTSYADPPLVGVSTPRPTWFMAKSELFDVPVLGPLLRHVHVFPVRRGTADRQALRRAQELLTAGEALVIFPEGGTSPDGRLLPPELGLALVALRAGVPIVPIAVIDSDRLLPRHASRAHFARVKVIFGEPLAFPHLAGKSGDREALREASVTVMRAIAALMRAHGASERVPDGYLEEAEEVGDGR